ncbi:MAG: (d)CMP kinase [Actinomycetota bacterium]
MERSITLPTDAELTIIAIDGPAGSGKSTVARRLADALDLDYLDTGAMYRSVTWAVLEQGIEPDGGAAVSAVAEAIAIDLGDDGTVVVDGHDVSAAIRGPEVSQHVSAVAANVEVRAELVARQREWARKRGGGVLEGRDIGTVVFPDAMLKIYLTASSSARAARRAIDENTADTAAVAADLDRRDALDSGRTADPLRQADGAYVLDTSDLSLDDVVEHLIGVVDDRRSG